MSLVEVKDIARALNPAHVQGEALPLKLAIDDLIAAGKLVLAGRIGSGSSYSSTKLFANATTPRSHFQPPSRDVATKEITHKFFQSFGPSDIGSGFITKTLCDLLLLTI